MILLQLASVASLAVAPRPLPGRDSLPVVELHDAIERAYGVDPDAVRARGDLEAARWDKRSSRLQFLTPAVGVGADYTTYSEPFFNIGTGLQQAQAATARVAATYDLFTWEKVQALSATSAALDHADATNRQQRADTRVVTERDYYGVLAAHEFLAAATERRARAREQLEIGRARVAAGVVVQTDSLQLLRELTEAEVDVLQRETELMVTQRQLGRRIGLGGPVDAAPGDSLLPPSLPMSLDSAVHEALALGPLYEASRAAERAAAADYRASANDYLPSLRLGGQVVAYDNGVFPDARTVASLTIGVSLPVWDQGVREANRARARANADVARALRLDLERAAARDVAAAYEGYETSRRSTELTELSLRLASETWRIQKTRYSAGASTILDLLDAQVQLADAQADLARARFNTRLALAVFEALIGRQVFGD